MEERNGDEGPKKPEPGSTFFLVSREYTFQSGAKVLVSWFTAETETEAKAMCSADAETFKSRTEDPAFRAALQSLGLIGVGHQVVQMQSPGSRIILPRG